MNAKELRDKITWNNISANTKKSLLESSHGWSYKTIIPNYMYNDKDTDYLVKLGYNVLLGEKYVTIDCQINKFI